MRRPPILIFSAALASVIPGVAAGTYPQMLFEEEPNDTVHTAQSFRGGARLIGEVRGEDRDKFRWEVDDAESDQLWRLQLKAGTDDAVHGLLGTVPERDAEPEGGGIAQFGTTADTEDETQTETVPLLELEATARRAVGRFDGLMVPHGEYLITLSAEEAGGDYQFTLEPVGTIELHATANADTPPENLPVRVDRDWYFQINASEFELPLRTEDTEDWLWLLQLRGELGTTLTATLVNADGEPLTDPVSGSPMHHRWIAEPLPEGSRLHIKREGDEPIGRVSVRLEQETPRPEPQPGAVATSLADAIELTPERDLDIRLTPEAASFLRFTVDQEQATEYAWAVDLAGETDGVSVCFGEVFTRDEACRPARAGTVFDALQVVADSYYLRLQSQDDVAEISVRLHPVPHPSEDHVPEPNDIRPWAAPLVPEQALTGVLTGERSAWFRLQVLDADQLWRIEARGEGIDELRLYRSDARTAWRRTTHPSVGEQISGHGFNRLHLLPGEYLLRVDGVDTDYRIQATRLGEAEPGLETEPNDEPAAANPLVMGQPMRGELRDSRDVDFFRFSLNGWNRVVLQVDPPEHGVINAVLYAGEDTRLLYRGQMDTDRGPLVASEYLPPGDYYLEIRGRHGTSGYRVQVDTVAPWATDSGHPFGDDISFASSVPADGVIDLPYSELGADHQWFQLPVGEAVRSVTLTAFGPNRLSRASFEVLDEDGEALPQNDIEAAHDNAYARQVELPADRQWYLRLESGRLGHIEVHVDDPLLNEKAQGQEQRERFLDMSLGSETHKVAAWAGEVQQIESELRLHNAGEESLEVNLTAHANHSGWRVRGLPESRTLAAGEDVTVPLTWILPAALPDDAPVHLFVGAEGADAALRIPVDAEAPAMAASEADSDIARQARGLVDLAWEGLGAHFVDRDSGEELPPDWGGFDLIHLIDGMSSAGSSVVWGHLRNRVEAGDPLPPLRLAGDGGRIRMLVVNQRSSHAPLQRWRQVEVSVGGSPDALEYLTTLELDNLDGEQYFPLDDVVEARYVGIRPLRFWGPVSPRDSTGIGAFQVLGEPLGDLAEARPNLLEPARGGHWIYSRPALNGLQELLGGARSRFLPSERTRQRGERIRGRRVDVVFGFLQQRAARLDAVSWRDTPDWDGVPVERVRVFTSLESPTGPWTEQGNWSLERDDGGYSRFRLDEPAWARYLRLEIHEPEPLEDGGRAQPWRLPAQIGAYEADSPASGESILAHWQRDGREGPFEAQHREARWPEQVDDESSSPEQPWAFEQRLSGRVHVPGDTRSYRITLAPDENTIAFRLRENMPGRLASTLLDDNGEEIPLNWEADGLGWREASAVDLEPGAYRLDLTEPVRALAFLWDASGSLRQHERAIQQAVSRFAERLRPGEEIANLMPLGGPMLLANWAEHPQRLRRALEAYDGGFISSNSEPALLLASRELEDLEHDAADGEHFDRVIFLITDAELNSREMDVWPTLERVRPRIFALEISHGHSRDVAETRWYQNLMLSWSAVGGGEYSYSVDRGGLIRAFEQGMRTVRQPTTYFLDAETRYQDPPEPGTLRIASGDTPALAAGAVHLIFDASGSMLRQMEGGRRIEVARRIVNEVLDDRIPEHVPVALRAYGHTEPHSCETELLVAPAEGNHDEVRDTVNAIQAINLARTPLAASLDAVPDDLAGLDDGRRLVVMLTDGEETCDGDVEASVEALVNAGMDLRLNIVGFHIDEIGMQAEFERFARQGGGDYFESRDGEELSRALQHALAAPYRVLDAEDELVAEGRVDDGKAMTLDAGEYRVLVDGADGERSYTLSLAPGGEKTLRLDEH